MEKIRSHRDLKVYQLAFEAALQIHEISKSFPSEEKYSLTDQVRRSSRSVSANLAEAWRKRRYKNHFISKLSDSEAEAGETQVWLEFSMAFKYIDERTYNELYDKYEHIIAMLINMSNSPENWLIK
jgi:four helix bundle protein